jgi:hypothetical protein
VFEPVEPELPGADDIVAGKDAARRMMRGVGSFVRKGRHARR